MSALTSSTEAAALAATNNATLAPATGSSFPIVKLQDGSQVPTGTVGALLINMHAYDEAHAKQDEQLMKEIESKIRPAVPMLKKIGMIGLFDVDEWEAGGERGRWGRALVGRIARELGD